MTNTVTIEADALTDAIAAGVALGVAKAQPKEILNMREAAELLGYKVQTFRQNYMKWGVPCTRYDGENGAPRFKRSKLLAWEPHQAVV